MLKISDTAGPGDPDLAFIAEHWHDLKPDIRRAVLHTVRSSIHPPDAEARRQAVQDAQQQAHSDDRSGDRTYPAD